LTWFPRSRFRLCCWSGSGGMTRRRTFLLFVLFLFILIENTF
jgi:hypothetical protein